MLVLYSLERLHMGALGFGLLTSALACGGIVGMVGYGWLERHVSLGMIMRGGLVIETLTHLVLAAEHAALGGDGGDGGLRRARLRLGYDVAGGAPARRTRLPMQGRVNSVNRIGTMGGIVVGSLIGGLIAGAVGRHRTVLVRLRRARRSSSC